MLTREAQLLIIYLFKNCVFIRQQAARLQVRANNEAEFKHFLVGVELAHGRSVASNYLII
ncbi:hypothetical protein PALI_b0144 [Pseudoalteromonas aliena SW19]|uniref:Uncharacterized protein n=1 Tax=Pseudoalteromonas aliena SW19 TaxID=1314866 RepID=A0ABR9E5J9_9GAMM|nr:hypothetical protein [Pseudoalteromonas aliena SW19]